VPSHVIEIRSRRIRFEIMHGIGEFSEYGIFDRNRISESPERGLTITGDHEINQTSFLFRMSY